MIARKLYDAGFTDLVSVIPPDGVLSTNSRIDPSQRGKVPGKLGKDGRWYGYSFVKDVYRNMAPRPEEIDEWGANIGLLSDQFPGIDIDVDDLQLATVVMRQAWKFFGGDGISITPLRFSRGSRKLLVYRTDEPFARMALKIEYKGVEHTVEVLGKGRQYVVHGTHPSGSEYRWDEQGLWDFKRDLITITKEDVDEFFTHLTEVLGDRAVCRRVGDGTTKDQNAPPQEELLAPDLPALAELVRAMPNADEHFPERDDYIIVGHAIKGAAGGEGEHLFLDWAFRWTGGENDRDIVRADWARMHPPFRVGWEWLQQRAREVSDYQPAQDIFEAVPGAVPPPIDPAALRQIDFSDEWAVSEILSKVRETIRFVPSNGSWYNWSGHRWVSGDGSLDHERVIRDQLRRLALRLRAQSKAVVEEKLEKALMAAARRLQNSAGIKSVIELLKVHVAVPLTDFDADPWVLNTPGGVVDLRTGDITPVKQGDMFTRSTSVTPEKGRAPLFKKFLQDLTNGDEELIRFLQRFMGYCLTGDISEKVLAFAWGSDSDTGKSTFIRTLSDLFGNYADSVDVEAFISARIGSRVPDDIARLPGTRLVTATEPTTGQHWDEKTIKAITGGDEISARKLYKSWFTFKPQFKIVIVGNAQPELRNVDDAMLRRILIVPMNQKVPRDQQIEDLSARMVAEEGPAIMHWLVQGCLSWASEGLGAPEAVQNQTSRYKDTQDVLAQWLEEECELAEGYEATRKDLYTAWKIWCRGYDYPSGTGKTFKMNMDARAGRLGLTEALVGRSRKRGYTGIRLMDMTAEEFQI